MEHHTLAFDENWIYVRDRCIYLNELNVNDQQQLTRIGQWERLNASTYYVLWENKLSRELNCYFMVIISS